MTYLITALGHLLNACVFFAGAIFLYAALFLYEDEEGLIQNTLEEWWVRLSDKQTLALSTHSLLIRAVARLTNTAIDRIVGPKLLSCQAIGVSGWYSLAFAALGFALLLFRDTPQDLDLPRYLLVSACVMLGIGSLPVVSKRLRNIPFWLLAGVITLSWLWLESLKEYTAAEMVKSSGDFEVMVMMIAYMAFGGFAILAALILVVGIIFDVLFITFTRVLMRELTRYVPSLMGASVLFLCTSLPAVVIIISIKALSSEAMSAEIFFWTVGFSNIPAVLVVGTFITLSTSLLFNQLFWPILCRPIYAAQKSGLIKKKKTLWLTSLTLIGASTPWLATSLRAVAKQLGF